MVGQRESYYTLYSPDPPGYNYFNVDKKYAERWFYVKFLWVSIEVYVIIDTNQNIPRILHCYVVVEMFGCGVRGKCEAVWLEGYPVEGYWSCWVSGLPVSWVSQRKTVTKPNVKHNGVMPVTNHLLRFTQPKAIAFLWTRHKHHGNRFISRSESSISFQYFVSNIIDMKAW